MAVTAAAYALSRQILFDQNAKPVPGGFVEVFAAGTTNHVTTYGDAGLTSKNPNPLRTDAFGRVPPIYFGQGSFRVVVYNQGAGAMWVDDGIPGGVDYDAVAAAAAAAAQSTTGQWQTGDVKAAHGSAAQAGWIILNGNTIGNAASGATARANADVGALFVHLWNNDGSLAVSNGRGVTATADFNAGKTIAVPDYRGRTVVGCDQMGGPSTAGVVTGASTPSPNTVGVRFGLEGVTLTTDGLPATPPSITMAGAGGHFHTGTTDGGGSHSHGGSTSQDGDHYHTYIKTTVQNFASGTGYGQANVNSDNTSTAGKHSHTITTDTVAAHFHTFTTASVNDHTHALTIANLGAGNPHGNMQPSVLIFWHIRL